jgi:quercetin dioxygenase-like cupin family protein
MKWQRGKVDVRTELFGGRRAVRVWDLLGARAAEPFSAVLACELEPGGSVGAHRQLREPELVIGLDGRGEARVDGRAEPLGPGAVVHLPLGARLELENLSDDVPLAYLIVKVRALEGR